MTDISRRDALMAMGAAPLAGLLDWSAPGLDRAGQFMQAMEADASQAAAYKPKFFTAHEWRTFRLLADMIIPRDARSGSATDARAPEFVDFMLVDKETSEASRVSMRGGLAWLDSEMRRRVQRDFLSATPAQRRAVLDDIAFPARARTEFAAGTAWFTRVRSNVGAAFFSSAMGWQDLRYMGNVFNPGWDGCPQPALDKLGVSYTEYDASLAARRRNA